MSANEQPKSFDVSLAEWRNYSTALADWALRYLLNRTDVYVRYLPLRKRADGRKVRTVKEPAQREHLIRHFSGVDVGNLIAIHSTSTADTCRWIAIDLDCHDGNSDLGCRNWNFAIAVGNRLLSFGITPLVIDSDGRGGIHILVLFADPIESQIAYRFAKWLVRDWPAFGISEPETLPKQPTLKGLQFGNSLRLPGRHHTRPHVTRALRLSGGLACGGDAAQLVLATPLNSSGAIPEEARNYQTRIDVVAEIMMVLPAHIANRRLSSSPALAKDEILSRARRYLDRSGPSIEGQGGDNHFWRLIWCIRTKFPLSVEEAYPLFLEWNTGCLPPFSPEYVWKQLQRVWSRAA